MVPDFVDLIVGREASRADVSGHNIYATTVSLGTNRNEGGSHRCSCAASMHFVCKLLDHFAQSRHC